MGELVFDVIRIDIAIATPEKTGSEQYRDLFTWLCVLDGGCQVAEHDFIEALAKYWLDVIACLGSEDLPILADQVDRLKDAALDNPPAAHAFLADLMHFLRDRLAEGHPVRQAMPPFWAAALPPDDLSGLAGVLAGLSLPLGLPSVTASAPQAGDSEPVGWLFSLSSLTERQVADSGVRPQRDDLIRLPGPDRQSVLPAFQFDADGRPLPIVIEVNLLLDAKSDPWGVADWWLSENAWLGRVPAEMLGGLADSDLISAARAALLPEPVESVTGSATESSTGMQAERPIEPRRTPGVSAERREE
jgi:hypothetical protein